MLRFYVLFIVIVSVAMGGCQSNQKTKTSEPPLILNQRLQILPTETYQQRAEKWASFVEQNPSLGRGWVQWGLNLRYAEQPISAYIEKFYQATTTDPGYAPGHYYYGVVQSEYYDPVEWLEAAESLQRALDVDPQWKESHYELWRVYSALGKFNDAKLQLVNLMQRNVIQLPLQDYGYNLLTQVDSNAVIFTNGDNEAYPSLCLQVVDEVRSDVAVVNLKWLKYGWYVRYIHDVYQVPLAISNQNIETQSQDQTLIDTLLVHIINTNAEQETPRPIYFSMTLDDQIKIPHSLILEGLVYRLGESDSTAGKMIDAEKITDNLLQNYQLHKTKGWGKNWQKYTAIQHQIGNYIQLADEAGFYYLEQNQSEKATELLTLALEIAGIIGYPQEPLLRQWLAKDPNNQKAKLWQSKLPKKE